MSAKSVLLSKWAALGGQSIVIAGLLARLLFEECPTGASSPVVVYWTDDRRVEMKNIPIGTREYATIRAMTDTGILSERSDTVGCYQGPTRMFCWGSNDSLRAWYPFFEGRDTTTLDIVGGRIATISGPRWAAGREHTALAFDGVDDRVSLGVLDFPASSFSLAATIKVARRCDIMARIIDKSTAAGNIWQFSLYQTGAANPDSFQLRMRLRTSASIAPVVVASKSYCIKADMWYDVAGRYDGKTLRLYVDSVLVASKPCTGRVATDPLVPVYVGWGGHGGSPFKGKIEDVKIGFKKAGDTR